MCVHFQTVLVDLSKRETGRLRWRGKEEQGLGAGLEHTLQPELPWQRAQRVLLRANVQILHFSEWGEHLPVCRSSQPSLGGRSQQCSAMCFIGKQRVLLTVEKH